MKIFLATFAVVTLFFIFSPEKMKGQDQNNSGVTTGSVPQPDSPKEKELKALLDKAQASPNSDAQPPPADLVEAWKLTQKLLPSSSEFPTAAWAQLLHEKPLLPFALLDSLTNPKDKELFQLFLLPTKVYADQALGVNLDLKELGAVTKASDAVLLDKHDASGNRLSVALGKPLGQPAANPSDLLIMHGNFLGLSVGPSETIQTEPAEKPKILSILKTAVPALEAEARFSSLKSDVDKMSFSALPDGK